MNAGILIAMMAAGSYTLYGFLRNRIVIINSVIPKKGGNFSRYASTADSAECANVPR